MPILPEPVEPFELSETVRHVSQEAQVTIRATFTRKRGAEALDALDHAYVKMRDQIQREHRTWGGGD